MKHTFGTSGRRRSRLIPVLAAAVALTMAAAGCGGDDGGGDDGGSGGSGEPITLGLVAPRSGALADFGEQVNRGAEIAVEEINAAGGVDGRKLQIVWEDDKSSNDGMSAAIRKFAGDKVNLQFGFTISSGCLAATPIGDQLGAVMLGLCAATGMTGKDRIAKNFFNVSNSTDAYNTATVQKLVATNPGVTDWSVFGFDYVIGKQQWETTKKVLAAQGVTVNVGQEVFVPIQTQDYVAQVDAMARNIDGANKAKQGLVLSTYGSGTTTFLQQAARVNLLDKFSAIVSGGNYWSAGVSMNGNAPEVWNGYDYWWDAEGNPPAAQKFLDTFRKKYPDAVPHSWNAEGYESVVAYATAIEKAGSTETDAVAKALTEITIEGLSGPYQLDPETHASNRPVTVTKSVGDASSPAKLKTLESAIVTSDVYLNPAAKAS